MHHLPHPGAYAAGLALSVLLVLAVARSARLHERLVIIFSGVGLCFVGTYCYRLQDAAERAAVSYASLPKLNVPIIVIGVMAIAGYSYSLLVVMSYRHDTMAMILLASVLMAVACLCWAAVREPEDLWALAYGIMELGALALLLIGTWRAIRLRYLNAQAEERAQMEATLRMEAVER